ncbi:valine--tRNA ligase [Candidatus Saccharibacteria bacterium]|nr:valine--tRNA ligase [Candidatus Saccharibacteria bacterium]
MKFTSSYEPQNFESDIYAAWESEGLFNPSEVNNQSAGAKTPNGRPYYSIVMPPPNANGNLHIGHGLTIALEDTLTRFYRLQGKSAWYIPGADHAGFETWVVYERALEAQGHSRFEYSRDELYAQVWDFVQEQRGNMELQVRALGASCAWDDLTFTLDENVVSRVYKTFEKMWNDGFIYRGEKLVNYCPKHQTAFADIEVEHKDEPGFLWDIAYEVVENSAISGGGEECTSPRPSAGQRAEEEEALARNDGPRELRVSESTSDRKPRNRTIIISTTRPETLFGDQAVAVNPFDARYKDLIGKFVKLPLTNRTIPIIADEHADPEYGTGAVKITPAHDFDDFEVGKRHNLENLQVIGDDGRMLPAAGKRYAGLSTEECRALVIKDLRDQGLLLGSHEISHAVAHCYKCGTVIEPTLKEQWFIDTEKLAKLAIQHLDHNEIKFYPKSKQKVLTNYLAGLKDWNISRQIPWGIPIPMFKKVRTESAGTGKDNFSDAADWIFDTRVNLKEIEVGGVKYVRDEDTFDTWFSSAHWPIVCTDWTEAHGSPYYPLNVMETGADILFAWIARMIMIGVYVTGEVPFKEVYLHGLVLDAHGKKMSKSKGNVINPMDLVAKYGSDAFRLGILRGRSAGMSQAFSEESVIAGRNLCNKLWNISRFIDGLVNESTESFEATKENSRISRGEHGRAQNVAGATRTALRSNRLVDEGNQTEFSLAKKTSGDSLHYDTLSMSEDWICRELNSLAKSVAKDLKSYRFAEAVEELYSTIWDKYADWFLESEKIFKNLPLLKRTLENLLIIAHPFMPFVTETIWQALSWTDGFLINQSWPTPLNFDPISAENFTRLQETVLEARRVLAGLKDAVKGVDIGLLYGDDGLIEENAELLRALTHTDKIGPTKGSPRGIRLALSGREVYLDVSDDILKVYKDALTERILSVGRELDALEKRLENPNYVAKAPAHLVEETRQGIADKTALISRLKQELTVIE